MIEEINVEKKNRMILFSYDNSYLFTRGECITPPSVKTKCSHSPCLSNTNDYTQTEQPGNSQYLIYFRWGFFYSVYFEERLTTPCHVSSLFITCHRETMCVPLASINIIIFQCNIYGVILLLVNWRAASIPPKYTEKQKPLLVI